MLSPQQTRQRESANRHNLDHPKWLLPVRDTSPLRTSTLTVKVMNSRPLVPESADPTGMNVLSHNNFLNCEKTLQPAVFAREPHHSYPLRVYHQAQQYADAQWTRWLTEYAPTMNVRHKWTETTEPLAKRELVWFLESRSPRGN